MIYIGPIQKIYIMIECYCMMNVFLFDVFQRESGTYTQVLVIIKTASKEQTTSQVIAKPVAGYITGIFPPDHSCCSSLLLSMPVLCQGGLLKAYRKVKNRLAACAMMNCINCSIMTTDTIFQAVAGIKTIIQK